MAKGNIKVCLHNYNSKQNCSLLDNAQKLLSFIRYFAMPLDGHTRLQSP